MKRIVTAVSLLASLAVTGQAIAGEKIIIGLGLSHGTADLASRAGVAGEVNTAFTSPEQGGRFEYWNMMKEHYALNFQVNVGFQREFDKLRSDATPGAGAAKFTTKSWSVRLGGDRVWSPLPNTRVFFGPGIEYWTGKAKFVGGAGGYSKTTPYETESVKRVSLHGHTGAMMMIGTSWGLSGQIGHKIGMATYEEQGGKSQWFPSSLDGAMEIVFSFGGGK